VPLGVSVTSDPLGQNILRYDLTTIILQNREEASTHKSAKTHTDNVFVTPDLDLWPLDLKINGFTYIVSTFIAAMIIYFL